MTRTPVSTARRRVVPLVAALAGSGLVAAVFYPAQASGAPARTVAREVAIPATPAGNSTDQDADEASCAARYRISGQWAGGFHGEVVVANQGAAVTSWTITFTMPGGQVVQQGWGGHFSQRGSTVTVRNKAWNGAVRSNATVQVGFVASWKGSSPTATRIALNNQPCSTGTTTTTTTGVPTTTSATTTSGGTPTTTSGGTPTTTTGTGTLSGTFAWSSSAQLISPKPDAAHAVVSVKDPTVVRYDDQWLVYFTVYSPGGGWNLAMTKFGDWSEASTAPMYFLDTSPIGGGYRAAPHLFYFAPKQLWYLVYQTGLPSYSTSTNPADPTSWSAPRNFMDSVPPVVTQNIGDGYWLDFFVACDDANCHLFSSDDNGHIYRAQTSVASFPSGWGSTVIALSGTRGTDIFEGSAHYKVQGQNLYLHVVEAWDDYGRRYYRGWTSPRLSGPYTAMGPGSSNPFAHSTTTTWAESRWTNHISHGEVVRAGYDQRMEINPCNLQFLYQGLAPNAGGDYNLLPYRLGLLTQTNSTC